MPCEIAPYIGETHTIQLLIQFRCATYLFNKRILFYLMTGRDKIKTVTRLNRILLVTEHY